MGVASEHTEPSPDDATDEEWEDDKGPDAALDGAGPFDGGGGDVDARGRGHDGLLGEGRLHGHDGLGALDGPQMYRVGLADGRDGPGLLLFFPFFLISLVALVAIAVTFFSVLRFVVCLVGFFGVVLVKMEMMVVADMDLGLAILGLAGVGDDGGWEGVRWETCDGQC